MKTATPSVPTSRQRILRAALRTFSRKGYHDTRMDDVAHEAKFSKGALYLYFPSKEALLSALLDRASRILLDKLDHALQRPLSSRQNRFALALREGLHTIERHRRLAGLLVKTVHLGPPFDDKLFTLHEAIAERISREIEAAIQEGDLPALDTRTVAHMWVGALYGVIYTWLHIGRPKSLLELFPTLCRTLLQSIGIKPDPVIFEDHTYDPNP